MTENNAAQAVSEETRQAMGEALTEFMSESAEDGVFSIDPFDSRNVDGLLDVVLSKLRAEGEPEQFKAAFPNGVLTSERFHEIWERAGKTRNGNYTLLENLTWQVGQFGDLVAQAASAPVAGEAQAAIGYLNRNKGRTDWSMTRAAYDLPDGTHMLYAAPQASAESVDLPGIDADRLRTIAASGSQTAMTNALLNVARALKQPQAEKDGGQQRACTCHPDDRPAGDCQKQYAATECQKRAGDVDVGRLLTAAKGMTKLYGHVWDRTDGALVVFPENVARFDAAFDALRAAVGDVVDDATQPEQGERDA